MHELSLALSLLDIAAEEAARRRGARIVAIHVKLGQLSGVAQAALVSAFGLAREMTAFETNDFSHCDLVIEEVPIMVHCPACAGDVPAESMQNICCSRCGCYGVEIVAGRELEVTAMEIEECEIEEEIEA